MIDNSKNCPDCQRLKKRYGEENLSICNNCGHLYYGDKCSCR